MAEYLDALLGVNGHATLIGDDDGGRLFHPYGERAGFGRATMATCAVLLQRPEWLRGSESRARAGGMVDGRGCAVDGARAARRPRSRDSSPMAERR